MKKLQTKMILFILTPTILAFAGLCLFISNSVYSSATNQANEQLEGQGELLSDEIEIVLLDSVNSVQTLSESVTGVLENKSKLDRKETDFMLQKLLESNTNHLSSWMIWKKDAFDGKDKDYANKIGHDKTGRYIPVWSKTANGKMKVEPVVGYDTPGELQSKIDNVFSTGETAIFEPFQYTVDGKEVWMTSIVSPVIINGKTVGMTGVDISLASLEELISSFSFYDTGFAGLLSNSGTVLAHRQQKIIGKNFFESDAMEGRNDSDEMQRAIQSGEKKRIQANSKVTGSAVYRQFSPIEIKGISTPWSSLLVVPIDEVTKEAKSIVIMIIIASVIVILLLAIIIISVSRNITKGLRTAVTIGQYMEAGDFTHDVPENYLKREDELGDLGRVFAAVSKSMRSIISQVQNSAQLVADNANAVDLRANESALAANEVAKSIEQVAQSSEAQMQSAEENAKAMEDMAGGVHTVASAATIVSDATNEMITYSNKGQMTVQNAVQQMDVIYQGTSDTKSVINELAAGASKIQNIVSVITDISEQTNLLALNAAIEAARAGDAGKGFAVVADEVRKLADETNSSASDIQQLIEDIQKITHHATQAIEQNGERVNIGIERMTDVESSFEQIILSVDKIVKEAIELSAISQEMSAGSEEIAAASEEMATGAESSYQQTHQVAAATEQQLASMEEIASSSVLLKTLANDLNSLLDQFKI